MMRSCIVIAFFMFIAYSCFGVILEETGSFSNFLFFTETACEYDRWISHVSEGIAIPDYNLYAPWERQTNGFGAFHIATANELTQWNNVINALIGGNYETAQSILNSNDIPYKIVKFNDTDTGRTYYLLRENLDLSYSDDQGTSNTYDDELGSFNYGWGLYIFNPLAVSPVIITVVHPNDDFIAPYIAAKAFVEWDAMFLEIAGAGREVEWTGHYSNGNSLSDPSRIDATAFNYAYKIFCNKIRQQFGKREWSAQIHSYDWNRHANHASNQISVGNRSDCINLPVRDLSDLHEDLIHNGQPVMIPANTIGNHPQVEFNDYYAFFENTYPIVYSDQDTTFECNTEVDLIGFSTNRQALYTLQNWTDYDIFDPFFHIEMDELPNCYNQTTANLKWFYGFNQVTGTYNLNQVYDNAWAYYSYMIHDITETLPSLFTMNDNQPPTTPINLQVLRPSQGSVSLRWDRSYAYDFKTYEVMYSTQPITETNYSLYTRDNDELLASQANNEISVRGLDYDSEYYFKIRARDYNNNLSCESNMIATTALAAIYSQDTVNIDFSCVNLGSSSTLQFTISNSGNTDLTGSIRTPRAFSVNISMEELQYPENRNDFSFSISARSSTTFNLQFTPEKPGSVNDAVSITSNDINHPSDTILVTGIGFTAPQANLDLFTNGCQLSWERVIGAIEYRIYRSDSPNGAFILVDTVLETFYTVSTDLPMGFFRIVAVSE
jgi:hypothetical protein